MKVKIKKDDYKLYNVICDIIIHPEYFPKNEERTDSIIYDLGNNFLLFESTGENLNIYSLHENKKGLICQLEEGEERIEFMVFKKLDKRELNLLKSTISNAKKRYNLYLDIYFGRQKILDEYLSEKTPAL